jgi:hypothetical protein
MTDELKDKFQQLVADPPPPTGVPSEAVFAKVRTVRRRRTAGVAALAVAAVAAIAIAGSSLTDINSSPPVSNKPGGTATVLTTPSSPAPPAIGAEVILEPKVTGRSMTMTVTVKGTVLVPLADGKDIPVKGTGFLDFSMGTQYTFGDGQQSGSDGGGVMCTKAKTRTTGQETYTLLEGPHVYAKAGTYTFKYTVYYCGTKAWFPVTRTATIVIP